MIAALIGIAGPRDGMAATEAVIDTAAGIGHLVHMARADIAALPDNERVRLWCVERFSAEQGGSLWGGLDPTARNRFLLWLKLPRLSAKVAIELAHPGAAPLLLSGSAKTLAQIPDLGPTLAAKALGHLETYPELRIDDGSDAPAAMPAGGKFAPPVRSELLSALRGLGFVKAETERMIGMTEAELGTTAAAMPIETALSETLRRATPR